MCVRAFSEEWALMSLLGTREGWPGTEDLGEVETAVVLLSLNPPAASRLLAQAQ